MSAYDELVDRCVSLCRDEMIGEDYLTDGIRGALAEVLRTLETLTPEMDEAWNFGDDAVEGYFHILHASPLVKP